MSDVRFDFKGFADAFADEVGAFTAVTVRKAARETVRVKNGDLRNSIRAEKVGEGEREVSANTEYAAAQEYGRPDLPNYGFTPYMRPAAKEGIDRLAENARKAREVAAWSAR
jgi:hypothetical protein